MSISRLLKSLTLNVVNVGIATTRHISSANGPLAFRAGTCLCSEPTKKKKRIDPQILIMREQKKKKRIEKQIRRLEKSGRILKPIEEIEGDRTLLKDLANRRRRVEQMTFDESEQMAFLIKDWTRYKQRQHYGQMTIVSSLLESQQIALVELRIESEELYQQAVKLDEALIPFQVKMLVKTPPIQDYYAPDGEYIDITKKYDKKN